MMSHDFRFGLRIMIHYQKDHMIFFSFPNRRSLYFKPLLEKAKPNLVDSYSDKLIAPIRNVGSQPLYDQKRGI